MSTPIIPLCDGSKDLDPPPPHYQPTPVQTNETSSQLYPTTTYTRFDMTPVRDPINHAEYPISSKLYEELAQKFGPQNIHPIPTWINTDEGRRVWLKRDANAQMYFSLRSDKYKKRIQEMIDASPFICCGYDGNASKKYSQFCLTGCGACVSINCTFCLCINPSALLFNSLMTPNDPTKLHNGLCCPCLSAEEMRKPWINRLRKSGLRIDDDSATICLEFWCFGCCYMAKMDAINNYYFLKRHGPMIQGYNAVKYYKTLNKLGPYWEDYISELIAAPNHPYNGANAFVGSYQRFKIPVTHTHEVIVNAFTPRNKLFFEWSNPKKCWDKWNKDWRGFHQVIME